MILNDVLHWISLGMIFLYAIACLVRPRFVAPKMGHVLNTGRGVSEFRILHGGFFLGTGLFTLYANHPLVYQAFGWSLIGAGLIRIAAIPVDRPPIPLSLIGAVTEIMLGIFMLV
jgi:hypothetical protein